MSEFDDIWARDGKRTSWDRVHAMCAGIAALRDAAARSNDSESVRRLVEATSTALACGDLALHVVVACGRIAELRATANELADAVGRESYVEAIAHAKELNRENAALRALVRQHAPICSWCWATATCRSRNGGMRACDGCAVVQTASGWDDVEHADVIRLLGSAQ